MGYDDGRKRFSILNPWYKGVVTHTYHEEILGVRNIGGQT